MRKYRCAVSADGIIEVEAENEDQAIDNALNLCANDYNHAALDWDCYSVFDITDETPKDRLRYAAQMLGVSEEELKNALAKIGASVLESRDSEPRDNKAP